MLNTLSVLSSMTMLCTRCRVPGTPVRGGGRLRSVHPLCGGSACARRAAGCLPSAPRRSVGRRWAVARPWGAWSWPALLDDQSVQRPRQPRTPVALAFHDSRLDQPPRAARDLGPGCLERLGPVALTGRWDAKDIGVAHRDLLVGVRRGIRAHVAPRLTATRSRRRRSAGSATSFLPAQDNRGVPAAGSGHPPQRPTTGRRRSHVTRSSRSTYSRPRSRRAGNSPRTIKERTAASDRSISWPTCRTRRRSSCGGGAVGSEPSSKR